MPIIGIFQGGTGASEDSVLYSQQTPTDAQKAQARANIGAMEDRDITADSIQMSAEDATTVSGKFDEMGDPVGLSMHNVTETQTFTQAINRIDGLVGDTSLLKVGADLVSAVNYVLPGDGVEEGAVPRITDGVLVWTVQKAIGAFAINKTNITLNAGGSDAVTVYREGNGPITAVSSDVGVLTATVVGDTVELSAVSGASGDVIVTIFVGEGDNHTAAGSKVVNVTVLEESTAAVAYTNPVEGVTYVEGFEGLSGGDVNAMAMAISDNADITYRTASVWVDYGTTHRKLSVGDTVQVLMNGVPYDYLIIGFNHAKLSSASGYGTETVTGCAGISFRELFVYEGLGDGSSFGVGRYTVDWRDSDIATTMVPSIYGAVQEDWRQNIKTVVNELVVSSNSSDNATYSIGTAEESVHILSEYESGSKSNSYYAEGDTYMYYFMGNSAVVSRSSGDVAKYLVRSMRKYHATVYHDGHQFTYPEGSYPNDMFLVPVFCI